MAYCASFCPQAQTIVNKMHKDEDFQLGSVVSSGVKGKGVEGK